jgi:hypothetical protein
MHRIGGVVVELGSAERSLLLLTDLLRPQENSQNMLITHPTLLLCCVREYFPLSCARNPKLLAQFPLNDQFFTTVKREPLKFHPFLIAGLRCHQGSQDLRLSQISLFQLSILILLEIYWLLKWFCTNSHT